MTEIRFVVSDPKTGMLGLKTDFIIPYLVNAIQEQQKIIDNLNTEVGNLKAENGKYKLQNNSLKTDVEKIKAYLELKTEK